MNGWCCQYETGLGHAVPSTQAVVQRTQPAEHHCSMTRTKAPEAPNSPTMTAVPRSEKEPPARCKAHLNSSSVLHSSAAAQQRSNTAVISRSTCPVHVRSLHYYTYVHDHSCPQSACLPLNSGDGQLVSPKPAGTVLRNGSLRCVERRTFPPLTYTIIHTRCSQGRSKTSTPTHLSLLP